MSHPKQGKEEGQIVTRFISLDVKENGEHFETPELNRIICEKHKLGDNRAQDSNKYQSFPIQSEEMDDWNGETPAKRKIGFLPLRDDNEKRMIVLSKVKKLGSVFPPLPPLPECFPFKDEN